MHWLKGEDFKGIKDDQAAERREFFLATDGKGRRGRQTNHHMGGMIMTEIRLKVDNPGKAVEVVVEALALEEARLQYSLELANKRLKFFEAKYGVGSERFMGEWTAEDLEGRDMEENIGWPHRL